MWWVILGLSILVPSLRATTCTATTIRVPADQPTIQAGIDVASVGDTVLVAPGLYTGPGNRNIHFDGKDLVLVSENGAKNTIISNDTIGEVGFLLETSAAVVDGFSIVGFLDTGAFIISAPTFKDCHFEANSTKLKGAAVQNWGSPTFDSCTFSWNEAGQWGGAIYSPAGTLTVRNCFFDWNTASRGAAIYCRESTAVIHGCTFDNNGGPSADAVDLDLSTATISSTTLHGNGSFDDGGAIRVRAGSAVEIDRTIVAFNGGEGVSVACPDASVAISCSDIFGNVSGDWIGCIAGQLGVNGNFSEDPLFCNRSFDDFTLDAMSPCAPENSPAGCGLIGALPVGCGATSVSLDTLPSGRRRLSVRPNPVVFGAEFTFDASAEPLAVEIYDPQGRLVEMLRPAASGLRWAPSASTTSGVYFAKLRAQGRTEVVKFVLVR